MEIGSITVSGIQGIPLIKEGDDISQFIIDAISLHDGDILCIASTIISKAKGYSKELESVKPESRAIKIAKKTGEDPRFIQVVLDFASDVLIETPFTLTELGFGHIGVRSGVDASNVEHGWIIYLPPDPMREAKELRSFFFNKINVDIGVIITDTCGRAFRRGQTGHAIGWSGMTAIRDFRGDKDLYGKVLEITEEAAIDEIAGFANLVMGESHNGVPAVLFRGIPKWIGHDRLYFKPEEDIIRSALKSSCQT